MHATSRPHAGDDVEPIPRRPLLSIPKLLAEGSPAEVQTVLGWRINTRELSISLPDDEFKAWTDDLTRLELRRTCQYQELEQLGRLNHASFVVPITRHYLNSLRSLLKASGSQHRLIKLDKQARADLMLWKDILATAHGGIPINLIVSREPNRICWSDACPFGIGGYSLSGRAWRIKIPHSSPIHGHPGVNNLLEFIGMVVNLWLECRNATEPESCILAIGNNTSAIGWLFTTSKLDPSWPAHDAHLMVARHLATLLLQHRCCIASQHIKGELNTVADLLSFVGTDDRGKGHPLAHDYPPNDVLTRRFHTHFKSQVPAGFEISQLPNDILCWVTQVLLTTESFLTAAKKGDTKTPIESGAAGGGSAPHLVTPTTPSSLCYPSTSESSSSAPSSSAIGTLSGLPTANLLDTVRDRWWLALSAKPQATWLRRFGAISGQAPFTSRAAPTCAHSCNHSSKRSRTRTQPAISNVPSPPNS